VIQERERAEAVVRLLRRGTPRERRRRGLLLLAAVLASAAVSLALSGAFSPRADLTARAEGGQLTARVEGGGEDLPRPGPAPALALLVTPQGRSTTSLYLARAGDASAAAPASTFGHAEDAAVRGSVLPGTDVVLATADMVRDAAFSSGLFRLAPGRPPELLVDRIVHAGRPLCTPSGRVFVSRGRAGPRLPGALRIGELSIDEIDPATGAARTVHAAHGHLLFLAGAFGGEILVYRVLPSGADLAAVDLDTGAVRLVVPELPPYARDFSIDEAAGAVVFQERDPVDPRAFTVERVDLATGARRRLYTGTSMNLAPFAWPGGGVAVSHEAQGIALLGGARPLAAGLLGPGVDSIQATSADGAWVAGVHTVTGRLPIPFAIDTRAGAALPVTVPAEARVYVAGFITLDQVR
jgi:hypothetical protein